MAIRPVDLQLAYLAAPANAALADRVQNAPQAAQAAAQSAFAAQVKLREEHVDQAAKAEGNRVKPRAEGDAHEQPQHGRPHDAPDDAAKHPAASVLEGETHIIDLSA